MDPKEPLRQALEAQETEDQKILPAPKREVTHRQLRETEIFSELITHLAGAYSSVLALLRMADGDGRVQAHRMELEYAVKKAIKKVKGDIRCPPFFMRYLGTTVWFKGENEQGMVEPWPEDARDGIDLVGPRPIKVLKMKREVRQKFRRRTAGR